MKNHLYVFMIATLILLLCPLSVLSEEILPPEISKDTAIHFPDLNFEGEVRKVIEKPEGDILASDVAGITDFDVTGRNIADLQGIEYFTGLETLSCAWNKLTKLDVSLNPALIKLICYGNELVELDISGAILLEELYCEGNQLTVLDATQNAALKYLSCGFNQLTTLDVSKSTVLEDLRCGANRLKSLDVSQNIALRNLDCWNNELIALDTSKNTKLSMLYCFDNQLTTLDVSNNVELWFLDCSKNRLEYLNLHGATALSRVYCDDNRLATLDVSSNAALGFLTCDDNQLSSLNVSGAIALYNLSCVNNLFPDISSIIGLDEKRLDFIAFDSQRSPGGQGKKMPTKEAIYNDVAIKIPDANFEAEVRRILEKSTGNIMLSDIADITKLTVSGLGIEDLTGIEHFVSLERLDCKRNQLTSLDISQNTMLEWLDCSWSQLETLDVSNNVFLKSLSCENNQLMFLDVTKNIELSMLCCYNNLFADDSAIAVNGNFGFPYVFISKYSDLM